MVVQYSDELIDAIYGDDAVLKYLAICEAYFKDGDRQALFRAIVICARYQAVMPDWVADALLQANSDFEAGQTLDYNEIFGLDHGKLLRERRARAKESRLSNATGAVMEAIAQARLDGASLNAEEMFGTVAEQLTAQGVKISRRDVEQIYKLHGHAISNLPRERDPNTIYVSSHTKVPEHRRRGRPTF